MKPVIGIDIQSTKGQRSGLGVFTLNFTEALKKLAPQGMDFRCYSKDVTGDLNTPKRLFWENCEIPKHAKRDRIQLLHTPAFAAPLIKPCSNVMTVHDLIGMVFPNQLGHASRFYWGQWLPWTAKGADAIIADSEHTKKDILERLKVPESKISVIYPSGHENFLPDQRRDLESLQAKLGFLKRPYFLCVGTLEPRKNVKRTIEAFIHFRKTHPEFQLIVVGSKTFAHGQVFEALMKDAGEAMNDICFTGYVSHEELNTLYSCAQAFLYPSLYEGFGIPVLEAMACGTPVLTSNLSSLPEVAGDAACIVDAYQTESIADGMDRLSKNNSYRSELITKGFSQIKKFSWQKTAAQTVKVYESLL